MLSLQANEIARRAQEVYDQRLRTMLETAHRDKFVAVEPDSGDYFLGESIDEAIEASRQAYPARVCYVMQIGHPTALKMGMRFIL